MKYFKLGNSVFAFEADGSQDNIIPEGMVELSSLEVEDHINPLPTKEELKQQVKIEAGNRILLIAPEWKQRNILARTVELRDIQDSRALTVEEQAEKDLAQSVWDSIKAIRTHSGTLEADIEDGKTVEISSGWPS